MMPVASAERPAPPAPPATPGLLALSVVIPCYNEARYLAETLESLSAQTYRGETEIIVVDNNCTDDTVAIAAEHGARVVAEAEPGVCCARQAGALATGGDVVVSTDADTTYATDWLARIAAHFADERVVAVVGPCRYKDGPRWGRGYARVLFGLVQAVYRLTGHVGYVSATNIAFRRSIWPGYDLKMTQGGDELDLLRKLRRKGRIVFDHSNPTFTSGRRLSRGILYNLFVTLLVHYLLTYWLNRLFGRRVLNSAPAYRDHGRASLRWLQSVTLAAALTAAVVLPFASVGGAVAHRSRIMVNYVVSLVDDVRP
jgi:glycosyltransferase involved in cell wall biosynthesis